MEICNCLSYICLTGEDDQWILDPFICPLYINICVPTIGMYVPVSRLSLLNRQISFTELNANVKIGIFVAFLMMVNAMGPISSNIMSVY